MALGVGPGRRGRDLARHRSRNRPHRPRPPDPERRPGGQLSRPRLARPLRAGANGRRLSEGGARDRRLPRRRPSGNRVRRGYRDVLPAERGRDVRRRRPLRGDGEGGRPRPDRDEGAGEAGTRRDDPRSNRGCGLRRVRECRLRAVDLPRPPRGSPGAEHRQHRGTAGRRLAVRPSDLDLPGRRRDLRCLAWRRLRADRPGRLDVRRRRRSARGVGLHLRMGDHDRARPGRRRMGLRLARDRRVDRPADRGGADDVQRRLRPSHRRQRAGRDGLGHQALAPLPRAGSAGPASPWTRTLGPKALHLDGCAGAADRNRHLPLHRHRGLDAAAPRARRRVRERPGRAPSHRPRGDRRARRGRGRHAGRRLLRLVRSSLGRSRRRRRGAGGARGDGVARANGNPYG